MNLKDEIFKITLGVLGVKGLDVGGGALISLLLHIMPNASTF